MPHGVMVTTFGFEPKVLSSNLSGVTKKWRVARAVMEQFAKLWSGNWPTGSNPVLSAEYIY